MSGCVSKEILQDAIDKHNLSSLDDLTKRQYKDVLALISYARVIGFDEGFQDGQDEAAEKYGY